MLQGFFLLLLSQLAGELMSRALNLPVPGPVIGMALLVIGLACHRPTFEAVQGTADGILKNLTLLFVPAATGVVQHSPLLSSTGLRLVLVVVVSTMVTMAVTAGIFAAISRSAGIGTVPGGSVDSP